MDRAQFEASLAADGFSLRESSMEAGTHNPDHTHPFSARLLVLSGEISVSYDGQTKTCRAGDHFALDANILHSEKVGPKGVSYVARRKDA